MTRWRPSTPAAGSDLYGLGMSAGHPPSPPQSLSPSPAQRATSAAAMLFAVAWLGYFAALQWSVVRYRIPIVATLTAATLALAAWQWRGWRVRLTRPAVAVMLAGSALATLAVP